MSHFCVLVLGDSPDSNLEPFSENREVDGYPRDCYCIGNKALSDAQTNTLKDLGVEDFDGIRESFRTLHPDGASNEQWRDYLKTIRFEEKVEEYNKKHPLYHKPDPECEQCKGTGKYDSTYNPDSKWDWYEVGGRWKGYFALKEDPMTLYRGMARADQAPKHHLDLEKEVEMRYDAIMKQFNSKQEASPLYTPRESKPYRYRCSKCSKTVEDSAAACPHCGSTDGTRPNYGLFATFAVLMEDGVWVEKGEMGWWGMSNDTHEEAEWEDVFDKIVNDAEDEMLFTLVDCHI